MTTVTPLQQPPIEDLRNAQMIADMWALPIPAGRSMDTAEAQGAFGDIARLVRHAIEGLSDPNLAAVQAAEILTREIEESTAVDRLREARDLAAAILRAQLTGEIPRTWNEDLPPAPQNGSRRLTWREARAQGLACRCRGDAEGHEPAASCEGASGVVQAPTEMP